MLILIVMVLGFSFQAEAALENRGTDSLGNRLIYDDYFDITWYDYSNSINTWQNQMDWANDLLVSGGDLIGVYDNWRLPTAKEDCSGYDCITSEMGHLYYTELGNIAREGLSSTGDFQNLEAANYWSGTEYSPMADRAAWPFDTNTGYQGANFKSESYAAIAVMQGDVSVVTAPEPISYVLFLTGGAMLGFRRFRKKITN